MAIVVGGASIGIQASPTCQRYVEKYIDKVVPHHYTRATLAKWAAWGKQHPNYHPPKRRTPATPQETFDKVNFACEVPPVPVETAGLLKPELPPEPLIPTTLVTIATSAPPTGPIVSLVNAPLQVPPSSAIGDVPEPGPWLYMLTGAAFLLLCAKGNALSGRLRSLAVRPTAL